MDLTVSVAQMDIALGKPEANLAKARELAAEARRRGSEVVVFPELWTTGYNLKDTRRYAADLDEGHFAQVAEMASENAIYIIGSLLEAKDSRYHNTAPIFSPNGERVGVYRKIHLFCMMGEDRYLSPGEETPVLGLPWGRCAIAICYDLRFPELFRKYALAGAVVVFLPAEWPHPRLAHWRMLLAARAIENQIFLVACNRVGESAGEKFFGHSAIYDPWGEALLEAGETEVLLTATLDLDLVERVRRSMPVFADRRPELY